MGGQGLRPSVGDGQWRLEPDHTSVILCIEERGHSGLSEVALTSDGGRLRLGGGQCRQEHRRQDGDHRDHHQQFHQSKGPRLEGPQLHEKNLGP